MTKKSIYQKETENKRQLILKNKIIKISNGINCKGNEVTGIKKALKTIKLKNSEDFFNIHKNLNNEGHYIAAELLERNFHFY